MKQAITIRVSKDTKYWIEMIQNKLNAEMPTKIDEDQDMEYLELLVREYIETLDKDFHSLSVNIGISTSSSSIIEAAIRTNKDMTIESFNKFQDILEEKNAEIPDDVVLGTLALRLTMDESSLELLEKFRHKFKPDNKVQDLKI